MSWWNRLEFKETATMALNGYWKEHYLVWTSYKAEPRTIVWRLGHAVFAPWIPTVDGVYNTPTVAHDAWSPCERWNETRRKVGWPLDKEKWLPDPTAPPRTHGPGDCSFRSCRHSATPVSLTSLSPPRSASFRMRWRTFRVRYRLVRMKTELSKLD